ncbi:MAG: hypothetical protein PHR11_07645, partial [Candidatus Omnitrophica bacterium]|nr:hypothetical protein [Candidatus Omnitrophota bacterium]
DGAGSVFTRVSRFLDEGNILGKFVETESAGAEDFPDISLEEILGDHPRQDQDFLDTMREYFRP